MINNFHLWKPYKEVELEYTPLDPNLNIFLQDKVGWGISSVLVICIFHHQRPHKEIELEKTPQIQISTFCLRDNFKVVDNLQTSDFYAVYRLFLGGPQSDIQLLRNRVRWVNSVE